MKNWLGKNLDEIKKDTENVALFSVVVAKIISMIAQDCRSMHSSIVVQALLITACHFGKHTKIPKELLMAYIKENYDESTEAVSQCVNAVFGSAAAGGAKT
jgi:hypothetical protein